MMLPCRRWVVAVDRAFHSGTPLATVLGMADRQRLIEIAKLFTKLGFTAFGGPAVHAGMMEDEIVHRRKWIDRQHFLDLMAAVNFIPGPNSTELAIHLGLIRGGKWGLVVAGVCFIVPAMLIILPLAWLYTTYGQMPTVGGVMHGISAAVIAIIAVAMLRLGRTALRRPLTIGLAIAVTVAGFLLRNVTAVPVELVLLGGAALVGGLAHLRPKTRVLPIIALPLAAPLPGSAVMGLLTLSLAFLRIGVSLFGSGYLLVPYLQAGLVDRTHLLTQQQMQDSIAIGQVTPGPLLTTATFAGYVVGHTTLHGGHVLGVIAGILATASIFAPSFLLVAVLGKFLPAIRARPGARGALDGMNAAVVAMIFLVLIKLAAVNLRDAWSIGLAVVAMVCMILASVNATWIIAGAGVVGWLVYR
jgi:chromate transporter